MPIDPGDDTIIDQKVLEEIIGRHKLWSNVDHVSDEALILAPRDRKVLLDMIERLLTDRLRLLTENQDLRTRLVKKISEVGGWASQLTQLKVQRDLARKTLTVAVEKVPQAGWPKGFLETCKGLIDIWRREPKEKKDADPHHGENGGGQNNSRE